MARAQAYSGPTRRETAGPLRVAMIGLRGIPATYGGVEKAVESLSVELVRRGHHVTVYTRSSYARTDLDSYRGVVLRHLPQVNTKHLEAASHTLVAMADAVRRGFDVIHVHAAGPALFSIIPRLGRAPCVATVHALDWRREKWGRVASAALKLGVRIAATVPDETIVVSRELADELERGFGRRPVHIPNGVRADDFREIEPVPGVGSEPFALFLGRLVPEKGVHTLLRAFARTDVRARLVVAGPSSHTDAYVRDLERLAARDPRVLLVGPRYGAQKSWLLRNADVLVNPSTLEGMPIVLLEAAACGRPCIVSDIPEHLEVVRADGRRLARTFRAEDEEGLADALREHFSDPERRSAGAPLAELVTERYRWERIAEQTEQVYRRASPR